VVELRLIEPPSEKFVPGGPELVSKTEPGLSTTMVSVFVGSPWFCQLDRMPRFMAMQNAWPAVSDQNVVGRQPYTSGVDVPAPPAHDHHAPRPKEVDAALKSLDKPARPT